MAVASKNAPAYSSLLIAPPLSTLDFYFSPSLPILRSSKKENKPWEPTKHINSQSWVTRRMMSSPLIPFDSLPWVLPHYTSQSSPTIAWEASNALIGCLSVKTFHIRFLTTTKSFLLTVWYYSRSMPPSKPIPGILGPLWAWLPSLMSCSTNSWPLTQRTLTGLIEIDLYSREFLPNRGVWVLNQLALVRGLISKALNCIVMVSIICLQAFYIQKRTWMYAPIRPTASFRLRCVTRWLEGFPSTYSQCQAYVLAANEMWLR